MRYVLVVEFMNFFADGFPGSSQRRNERQQIEGAGIGLVGEHAAAADDVTVIGRSAAIEAAAKLRGLFENADVGALQAAVADQIGRAGERGDAAADQIGLGLAPLGGSIGVCHEMFAFMG